MSSAAALTATVGFALDLTPHLSFGQDNIMAVRLTPEDAFVALVSGRRHLSERVARHVPARFMLHTGALMSRRPEVSTCERHGGGAKRDPQPRAARAHVTVETAILDAAGQSRSAGNRDDANDFPRDKLRRRQSDVIRRNPQRWDIDQPYLYRASDVPEERR